MTEHVRTRIRRNLVRILTGLPRAMDNVFTSRVRPLQSDQVPAIDVDAVEGGEVAHEPLLIRLHTHTLSVTIAVTVKRTDGYLDLIDEIYVAIDQALAANNTLELDDVPACSYIVPTSEPSIEAEDIGDETIARAEVVYEVRYITEFSAPQTLVGVV